VGRSGGTDFLVVMANASQTAVQREADRFLSTVMAFRFEWESMQFSVGGCVGVVQVTEHYQSVDSIFMDAQAACLTAAEEGGNRVQIYSSQERSIQQQQNRILWASRVDEVLQSESLRLKVHKIAPTEAAQSASDKPLLPHYEVLIGDLGETVGSVFDFISAAERYKRMGQVDRWIVQQVCDWMCAHSDFVDTIGGLSINLSGNSLNEGDFIDHLFQVFTQTEVRCDKLCFEITETVALANLNDTVDFMREMKNLGCRFAMDDFGTGMSSFAYLKHLPVDYLKIDGAFVQDMQSSRHDMAMVKSITDMGHLLGKKVVAEYVVDATTLSLLESIGVDYCQGFFLEEPIWLDAWQDSDHIFDSRGDGKTKPDASEGVA
jgi:EAL domain-containing protein (putative c-di-GMP-specific phosphodiesterase class I)